MSDKYYFNDCNSQGYHCCSNSYTMIDKSNRSYAANTNRDQQVKPSRKVRWWQRLWERDAQPAQS